MKATRTAALAPLLGAALCALGCGTPHSTTDGTEASASAGLSAASSAPTAKRAPGSLSLAAELGKKLFFDKTLSASGNMSCATCHDPDHAYGPPNSLAVQLGGPKLDQAGTRAAPSLRYKEFTPAYADLLDNPDGISAPGPGGGFTWDGRTNTLAEQAKLPLLSPVEMANENAADVASKVLAAPYADLFRQLFNADAKADPDGALNAIAAALQAFQLEDRSFHPYTSKFDLYAGNKIGGTFTAAEKRGGKVFSDPKLGNCFSCHYQGPGINGSSGLYTDFSYEAIGVPRNRELPVNADDEYYDLGLCGPARGDHLPQRGVPNAFCGMFKAPTLRNMAKRTAFFHNGVMHSLEQVIRFYNTRDTRPELWYPTLGGKPKASNDPGFPSYGLITTQYTGGKVDKYDDLPTRFLANIDPQMPLDGRKPGSPAPLSEQNISDLLCFLDTLNDDYVPPATPPTSGPCVN
ncbi:MAG TPA: cytochrome c peroxidase [Polyangiaceae bacterium]|jgi:cytochrome c peroxidase|nr:cytochrome c peroxidase [Polyangiaceae bacterium]